MLAVVCRSHRPPSPLRPWRPALATGLIYQLVLKGQALVADARHTQLQPDFLAEGQPGPGKQMWISATIIAQVVEILAVPQPQLDEVSQAGLLEVGQVARVIDVPLRVEIAVAHFDGDDEADILPSGDYTWALLTCPA